MSPRPLSCQAPGVLTRGNLERVTPKGASGRVAGAGLRGSFLHCGFTSWTLFLSKPEAAVLSTSEDGSSLFPLRSLFSLARVLFLFLSVEGRFSDQQHRILQIIKPIMKKKSEIYSLPPHYSRC